MILEGMGTPALVSSAASYLKKLFEFRSFFLFKIPFFVQTSNLLFILICLGFSNSFRFILQLILTVFFPKRSRFCEAMATLKFCHWLHVRTATKLLHYSTVATLLIFTWRLPKKRLNIFNANNF